jgi:two-component system OmpR family response regulator
VKILLVDDDADLLAVTGFALQQAGFLVVKAGDGAAALDAFQREQPDLAVLDINLPKMSGFELAQKLRERSKIPLIMLTARNEEEDVVRALSLGADDYLSKPFSPKILLARVKALLRRVGLEAEETVACGHLALDVAELTLRGLPRGDVRLTPLEARFLQLLFAHSARGRQPAVAEAARASPAPENRERSCAAAADPDHAERGLLDRSELGSGPDLTRRAVRCRACRPGA